jgi:hypothetical protein
VIVSQLLVRFVVDYGLGSYRIYTENQDESLSEAARLIAKLVDNAALERPRIIQA